MKKSDLIVENHGTILLLFPATNAGRSWIGENIGSDAQRWAGAVVVEPRYIADIVIGARADGLEVR